MQVDKLEIINFFKSTDSLLIQKGAFGYLLSLTKPEDVVNLTNLLLNDIYLNTDFAPPFHGGSASYLCPAAFGQDKGECVLMSPVILNSVFQRYWDIALFSSVKSKFEKGFVNVLPLSLLVFNKMNVDGVRLDLTSHCPLQSLLQSAESSRSLKAFVAVSTFGSSKNADIIISNLSSVRVKLSTNDTILIEHENLAAIDISVGSKQTDDDYVFVVLQWVLIATKDSITNTQMSVTASRSLISNLSALSIYDVNRAVKQGVLGRRMYFKQDCFLLYNPQSLLPANLRHSSQAILPRQHQTIVDTNSSFNWLYFHNIGINQWQHPIDVVRISNPASVAAVDAHIEATMPLIHEEMMFSILRSVATRQIDKKAEDFFDANFRQVYAMTDVWNLEEVLRNQKFQRPATNVVQRTPDTSITIFLREFYKITGEYNLTQQQQNQEGASGSSSNTKKFFGVFAGLANDAVKMVTGGKTVDASQQDNETKLFVYLFCQNMIQMFAIRGEIGIDKLYEHARLRAKTLSSDPDAARHHIDQLSENLMRECTFLASSVRDLALDRSLAEFQNTIKTNVLIVTDDLVKNTYKLAQNNQFDPSNRDAVNKAVDVIAKEFSAQEPNPTDTQQRLARIKTLYEYGATRGLSRKEISKEVAEAGDDDEDEDRNRQKMRKTTQMADVSRAAYPSSVSNYAVIQNMTIGILSGRVDVLNTEKTELSNKLTKMQEIADEATWEVARLKTELQTAQAKIAELQNPQIEKEKKEEEERKKKKKKEEEEEEEEEERKRKEEEEERKEKEAAAAAAADVPPTDVSILDAERTGIDTDVAFD